VLFAGACGPTKVLPDDADSSLGSPDTVGSESDGGDASPTDAPEASLCTGAASLAGWNPAPTTPYVTLSIDGGPGCVFLLGDVEADPRVCGGARPTGYTETSCPTTTVDFAVWSDAYFMTEIGVQGAYAYALRGGALQDGRVLEMVIDQATADMTRGHFQLAFDPSGGFPPVTATGTFSMCTTPATSLDPCRQPNPLVK